MSPRVNRSAALRARPVPSLPEGMSAGDVRGVVEEWIGGLAEVGDRPLILIVGAALFVLAAWPLFLVQVPPYQDLPNHLATATVIEHRALYPELVFNGWFKTNGALFAWLGVVGPAVGLQTAAKLFALGVLAVTALALPWFLLEMVGRRRMLVASLFAWPMIHNWFVSTGMLDFALAVPLALVTLIYLRRHLVAPSGRHVAGVIVASVGTWYAHSFPLLVIEGLVGIHLAEEAIRRLRGRGTHPFAVTLRRLAIPMIPALVLSSYALFLHLTEPGGAMNAFRDRAHFLPTWELVYNLWAEWMWGYTKLSISSMVPTALLALWVAYGAWRHLRPTGAEEGVASPPHFFSPFALAAILAVYAVAPYELTNWYHVNSRLIPFFWIALLVRVPDALPRAVKGLLVTAALAYSAGMGVDTVRLDRERDEFTAGMSAVPENARLLPLVFRAKHTSENTRNLLHAWGYYVAEKHTSAPLLFAHSRSFPVMYATPPSVRMNHLMLEGYEQVMGSPGWVCGELHQFGVGVNDCAAEYRARWREFWGEVGPIHTHLLLWDATKAVLENVPADYKLTLVRGRLRIYERMPSASASVP